MTRYFNQSDLSSEKARLLDRVRGYSELGMYKEAVEESKKLVKIDWGDPSSFFELAYSYEENGEIKKAIRCYKYAIKRLPAHTQCLTRLYTNLGYCFEKYKKQHSMAMVCYEKALELDPHNEWALNNIGSMLKREGKRKESLSYYLEAYKTCNQKYGSVCGKIKHNLAWAFYLCGNYEAACNIYSRLAAECPEKYYVLSDYGCACYRMKDYENALDLFERARSMYPKVRYYRRLAQLVRKKIASQR